MFGPPVPVKEDEVGQVVVGVDTTDGAGRPTGKEVSLGGEEFRRSFYVQVRRSKPLALLDTFDKPAMEPNCDARTTSTVAPQSLLLMNSEFITTHARYMAERLTREAGGDARQRVTHLWQLAFAREPRQEEVADSVKFIEQQTESFQSQASQPADGDKGKSAATADPSLRAWALLCQALLSANEFLYID
jgi:hypothetical protein